jgi:tRNA (cmo5U34)-methyltransferase
MTGWQWDPDRYVDEMLAEIADYPELQAQTAAAAQEVAITRMLELGIGTGETAQRMLALHPNAQLTGIDASSEMLEHARPDFPGADLRLGRLEDPLPEGPFDLVYSTLVVHHLDRAGKRDLFRRIAEVLRPDGLFVLADLVVPDDPADVVTPIDWEMDLPDRLDDQLDWLLQAGFEAEPQWTYKDLAVVRAKRPVRLDRD